MALMISANIKRGSAELAVLSVLAHRRLHGYEIAQRIEQQTQGALRSLSPRSIPCFIAWSRADGCAHPGAKRLRDAPGVITG